MAPSLSPTASPTLAPTMSASTLDACLSACTGGRLPVCGEDGNMYSSSCAAMCQGIGVVDDSLCDAASLTDAAAAKWVADGELTSDIVNKFEREGFVYLGRQTMVQADPERIKEIVRGEAPGGKANVGRKQRAIRATNDGYVYGDSSMRRPPVKPQASHQRKLSDFMPKQRRELDVIGLDDRTLVQDTSVYPYSAIGLIGFGPVDFQNLCSGMVVASDAIVTAAHCVHEGSGGSFFGYLKFAPGAVNTTAPFGIWSASHVTTYTSWAAGYKEWEFDIAIIRFSQEFNPDKGLLADIVGAGSMTPIDCSVLPTVLLNSGYPSDKFTLTNGIQGYTQWYQQCKNDEICTPGSNVLTTSCDLIPGQSGSPLYMPSTNSSDSKVSVYGVGSHIYCPACNFTDTISSVSSSSYPLNIQNDWTLITPAVYADLISWATE